MLDKIKLALRISHNKIDDDILDHILACKEDLKRVGIVNIYDDDKLIIQVIKLYVKWQLNFENQAERYFKSYERLSTALSQCSLYNGNE